MSGDNERIEDFYHTDGASVVLPAGIVLLIACYVCSSLRFG